MLKSLIFCLLLGSALCFAQTRNNPPTLTEMEVEVEIKIKGNNGGADDPLLLSVDDPESDNLIIKLFRASGITATINKYSIYDMSNNLKKEQTITPTSSYSADISSLSSGDYKVTVNNAISTYFYKQ